MHRKKVRLKQRTKGMLPQVVSKLLSYCADGSHLLANRTFSAQNNTVYIYSVIYENNPN